MTDRTRLKAKYDKVILMQKEVLLIEDEFNWQRELTRMLKEAGCLVKVASTRAEGIEALKRGTVSLAIVDVSLIRGAPNDRGGISLLKSYIQVPAICISGYLSEEEIEHIVREGLAEAVFNKRYLEEEAFVHSVQSMLSSHESEVKALITEAPAENRMELKRVITIVRRAILATQIIAVVFAFLAGVLTILSSQTIRIQGIGSGYFAGLGMCCGALSIECLLCLKFLSHYYELHPQRRKHGEEESHQKS